MRRRFAFGPGISIALLLALWLGYQRYQESRQPPRVERYIVSQRPGEGTAPELSLLLEHRSDLALTDRQAKDIERLYREWRKVSALKRRRAEAEGERFRQWMEKAGQQGKVSLSDIQAQGQRLSQFSAETAHQRYLYWRSGLSLLTSQQRKKAEGMKGK
ncbi:MAG: hypothetical protein IT210_03360 [Armatimonadetes bacterium]|nr:hypothetical protein [Armatimonadota bacterium]